MGYYDKALEERELAHFGIPGMKWGVRRFESASGHLTPAGQARYNTVEGKYQKVKAAKAKANASYKQFNSDWNKAAVSSLSLSKKRRAQKDALKAKAHASGQKADKDIENVKKAQLDLKYTKKIAKNEAQRDKMLEKRVENRTKLESKAAKAQEKGNLKKAERMQTRIKDFDKGTKYVKSGYDNYSKTIKDYSKAKISSIGDKDAKKSDSYKSAAKAYRRQTVNDLINGKTNTIAKKVIDAAVSDAEKRAEKQRKRGNI